LTRVRQELEGESEDGRGLLGVPEVEEDLPDEGRETALLRRIFDGLHLELADLGDHVHTAHLVVDVPSSRQRLDVLRERLPGALVDRESAIPLGDHLLRELADLVEAFGSLRLGRESFRLSLEVLDRLAPVR
jgi:hypothetical protein